MISSGNWSKLNDAPGRDAGAAGRLGGAELLDKPTCCAITGAAGKASITDRRKRGKVSRIANA